VVDTSWSICIFGLAGRGSMCGILSAQTIERLGVHNGKGCRTAARHR